MESKKGFFNSKTHDFLNFFASLIGILGFLTGVSNLPSIISGNGKEIVSWFGSQISHWLSVPVFIITIFFVYGLYFMLLVQVYKWLKLNGTTDWNFSWFELRELLRHKKAEIKYIESTLVSVFFFQAIGLALGGLIFQSFFGQNYLSEIKDNILVILILAYSVIILYFFLAGLCGIAQETASHIVYEVKYHKKEGV